MDLRNYFSGFSMYNNVIMQIKHKYNPDFCNKSIAFDNICVLFELEIFIEKLYVSNAKMYGNTLP